jgi:hypothetical protein
MPPLPVAGRPAPGATPCRDRRPPARLRRLTLPGLSTPQVKIPLMRPARWRAGGCAPVGRRALHPAGNAQDYRRLKQGGARHMSRFLIALGIILILAGLLWPLVQKLGLGRLPGDIVIERGGARIYIPIVSGILVSVVLSVVLNLILWIVGR